MKNILTNSEIVSALRQLADSTQGGNETAKGLAHIVANTFEAMCADLQRTMNLAVAAGKLMELILVGHNKTVLDEIHRSLEIETAFAELAGRLVDLDNEIKRRGRDRFFATVNNIPATTH